MNVLYVLILCVVVVYVVICCVVVEVSFINTQKSIYIAFDGWLPSFKEFLQTYTRATKEKGKHYALVYQAGGEDLASTYLSWRAPLVKQFTMEWYTYNSINPSLIRVTNFCGAVWPLQRAHAGNQSHTRAFEVCKIIETLGKGTKI